MKLWSAATPGPGRALCAGSAAGAAAGDGWPTRGLLRSRALVGCRPWPRGCPARRAGISAPGRAPAWR